MTVRCGSNNMLRFGGRISNPYNGAAEKAHVTLRVGHDVGSQVRGLGAIKLIRESGQWGTTVLVDFLSESPCY